MLGKIDRLKRKIILELDKPIFDIKKQRISELYDESVANCFGDIKWSICLQGYKINKYVFDDYEYKTIINILGAMHKAWDYEASTSEREFLKIYAEKKSHSVLYTMNNICDKYYYYIQLNKLYKNILNIKSFKTLKIKSNLPTTL